MSITWNCSETPCPTEFLPWRFSPGWECLLYPCHSGSKELVKFWVASNEEDPTEKPPEVWCFCLNSLLHSRWWRQWNCSHTGRSSTGLAVGIAIYVCGVFVPNVFPCMCQTSLSVYQSIKLRTCLPFGPFDFANLSIDHGFHPIARSLAHSVVWAGWSLTNISDFPTILIVLVLLERGVERCEK